MTTKVHKGSKAKDGKLIFIDEYDWGYANKKKEDYKNIVADCGFNVVAGADSK